MVRKVHDSARLGQERNTHAILVQGTVLVLECECSAEAVPNLTQISLGTSTVRCKRLWTVAGHAPARCARQKNQDVYFMTAFAPYETTTNV